MDKTQQIRDLVVIVTLLKFLMDIGAEVDTVLADDEMARIEALVREVSKDRACNIATVTDHIRELAARVLTEEVTAADEEALLRP